ncbi:hypothetical protein FEM48_Zijuj07G0064500 [Ziziphus jujuba var. spinosa]|uniref:Tr-type G domain-containing protein n=1 Tax=Ziziphus jujuba var. spinosa TaxID=714518 RepID=A0A978V306_ZIZJJ|nr:hypothetical protein FEM48_Zijuj07G0064500 [Ziziphus jujuba var. spinosa]
MLSVGVPAANWTGWRDACDYIHLTGSLLVFYCSSVSGQQWVMIRSKFTLVMGHVDSSKSQVLDNLKAERERGNAMRELKIDKYHFTFIDAFGHPDFIKDILTGHCWADCALLIIDSTGTGDFDEQARLHALLAYTPGIKQMICCFNKVITVQSECYFLIKPGVSTSLEDVLTALVLERGFKAFYQP